MRYICSIAISVILFLVQTENATAQQWQKEQIQLTQVSTNDGINVWGVNSVGQIFRTTNSGASWEGVPGSLKQVSAGDGNIAWGVNSSDAIYRTRNGGTSWEGVSGLLRQVSTINYSEAWGVNSDGAIYRTRNGGLSWEGVPGLLKQVAAISYDYAWGVNAAGAIYRTPNGGQLWESVPGSLKHVSLRDYDTAWGINTTGKIYRTNNGGENWERASGILEHVAAVSYGQWWGVVNGDDVYRNRGVIRTEGTRYSARNVVGDFNALPTTWVTQETVRTTYPSQWENRDRDGLPYHIQGVAQIGNTWVFVHNRADYPGFIMWGVTGNQFKFKEVEYGRHPGGIQASGNVFVVPIKEAGVLDEAIAKDAISGTTTADDIKNNNRIAFYQLFSNRLIELTHLSVPNYSESAGIAYDPDCDCYYMLSSRVAGRWNPSNASNRLFKSVDRMALEDPNNRFTLLGSIEIPSSQSGVQLVYDKENGLFVVSMGNTFHMSNIVQGSNIATLTKIDLERVNRNTTAKFAPIATKEFDDTWGMYTAPNFAYGAGVVIDAQGVLNIFATAMEIGDETEYFRIRP
ncbi:MAG: hypothetical protein GXP15_12175 [Gammaproteobacteria bacterium]|nr:hypothetical protein [Gammaproteobacteria bacterium]